ncbi:hypothetical protein AGR1A_pAt20538 [Agrobacterium fabacearum CFBP 5771]|nr:hypothetical protein AGR1A_pAt20538 [Agrobacterium fabacearum CFBP 5771]
MAVNQHYVMYIVLQGLTGDGEVGCEIDYNIVPPKHGRQGIGHLWLVLDQKNSHLPYLSNS